MSFTVNYHWTQDQTSKAKTEKVEPHDSIKEPYYRIKIGWDLCIICTPAQALELRAAISDCPELREWEQAQQPAKPQRNANVAEPFRGIVNAISEVR